MSNDLVIFERQLQPLVPQLAQVLGATMPVERLVRTVMVSVEKTPKLLSCNRQSLFSAAMSAAVLSLEVDGVTGQAFLIPFGDKAQLVIGYKGYNTLAARSGFTVRGACVRDGDEFDFDLASGFILHKPKLTTPDRRIIAAWALAAHSQRPGILQVMGIEELMAVKAKSPGAKKSDSPWNDPKIGFPAMCEKTPKRRLARSMPLNVMQLAARMDEAFEEQGKHAIVTPDKGVIIEGEFSPIPQGDGDQTPTAEQLTRPITVSSRSSANDDATENRPAPSENEAPSEGAAGRTQSEERRFSQKEYFDKWDAIMEAAKSAALLHQCWNAESEQRIRREFVDWDTPTAYQDLKTLVAARIEALKPTKAKQETAA